MKHYLLSSSVRCIIGGENNPAPLEVIPATTIVYSINLSNSVNRTSLLKKTFDCNAFVASFLWYRTSYDIISPFLRLSAISSHLNAIDVEELAVVFRFCGAPVGPEMKDIEVSFD